MANKKVEISKTQRFVIICVSVIAALLIVISVSVNAVLNSGVILRNATAAETANFKVDNAMFSYFFYTAYNGEMEEYSSYYENYYGFDSSVSLKKQNYDDETTWFAYFLQNAKSQLMDMLLFAEAAIENGYQIDEEDKAYIENEMSIIENAAAVENMSVKEYIFKTYGRGVQHKDIENALKIILLANKQYEHLENTMELSTDEINSYFNEHKELFTVCDIREYIFAGSDAESNANRLAAVKSEEEYKSVLREILKNNGSYTDSQIDKKIEDTLTEGYEYTGTTEVEDWAFVQSAKVGDTKTVYYNGEYTVYIMVREPYADEYVTKNVRHILLSAEVSGSMAKASLKAKEVLAQFEKTDKSEESFIKLAMEHNTDSGSYENGGLYKNATKGTYVEEFENWCFDESRKVGDYEIIKTDYGYHIMYFCGDGLLSWQAAAKDELKLSKINEMYDIYAQQYPVQFDDNAMMEID